MGPIIAAGVLAIQLAGGPAAPEARSFERPAESRNPFSRLGRAVRRVGSVEPALAIRFSGIGIHDRDDDTSARPARKRLQRRGPLAAADVLPEARAPRPR